MFINMKIEMYGKRNSIVDFLCKLSSDLINKIYNRFSGFQKLSIVLKKVESSEFFSRKY